MRRVKGDDYFECRVGSLRHAWDDHDGSGFRRPPFGLANHYVCLRCGTVKRIIVSSIDGTVIVPVRYYHPKGYERSMDEKPPIDQVRLWEARRQREAAKEQTSKSKSSNVTPITKKRGKTA